MLIHIHPHPGQPIAPHDVWGSWNPDPLILAASLTLGWAYMRGNRGADWLDTRSVAFGLGMGAVLIALTSPLDAVAGSLASAHMVQHMLLVVIAGPLLAWSRPLSTMLRGSPLRWRKVSGRWRRRTGLTPSRLRFLGHPGAAWLTLAGVIWLWHSAALYGAALRLEAVHALE
ncbi:MAG: cytochrome c oxidase assembly protein, partial [Candidatus Limnocylindria bacterium]